jgi:hypothetical protein
VRPPYAGYGVSLSQVSAIGLNHDRSSSRMVSDTTLYRRISYSPAVAEAM